jgi:hypothetical protein
LLGLVLAVWWSDLLIALGKEDISPGDPGGTRLARAGLHLGVSVLTGLVFGLVPALHLSKTQLIESLKEGAGAGAGAKSHSRSAGCR